MTTSKVPEIVRKMAHRAFLQLGEFIDKRIKERCHERISTDPKNRRMRGDR